MKTRKIKDKMFNNLHRNQKLKSINSRENIKKRLKANKKQMSLFIKVINNLMKRRSKMIIE